MLAGVVTGSLLVVKGFPDLATLCVSEVDVLEGSFLGEMTILVAPSCFFLVFSSSFLFMLASLELVLTGLFFGDGPLAPALLLARDWEPETARCKDRSSNHPWALFHHCTADADEVRK